MITIMRSDKRPSLLFRGDTTTILTMTTNNDSTNNDFSYNDFSYNVNTYNT